MVTKTMPIEAPSGQTGTVNDRSAGRNNAAGSGFSDVLGNVGNGVSSGRKQPGTAGSSMKDSAGGRAPASFEYTRRAAESVQDGKSVQFAYSEPGQRVFTAENGTVFDESTADRILARAAEIVTQTVKETGEIPGRNETAVMLTDALAGLRPDPAADKPQTEEKAQVTEDNATTAREDTGELIDTLIRAVNKVSGNEEAVPETAETEETAAAGTVINNNQPTAEPDMTDMPKQPVSYAKDDAMILPAQPEDDAAEVISSDTDAARQPDDAYAAADKTVIPETYVPEEAVTQENDAAPKDEKVSGKKVITRKNADTAAGREMPEDSERTERPERSRRPEAKGLTLKQPEQQETRQPVMPEMTDNDIAAAFMAGQDAVGIQMYGNAAAEADDITVPDFSVQRDLPKGYSVVKEMFAAPERGLPISTSDLTQTEELPAEDIPSDAVNETFRMLTQLIRDAKKELGLTEVVIEYTEGDEPEEMLPMMPDEHVRLSRQLNGSDRSSELDHILNAGRIDAPEENSPKTQTYDAVRMSEQLMGSRTDTAMRAAAETEFRDDAQRIARPPEVQLTEQILSRLDEMQTQQRDRTEFTMVLNPESLGRITVKLVMTGEKTAVEINAENPDTRALLASRSESLQNMLRDNGVQLERYQVVSEQEDAAFERQSYEGSSKNPYSRNDDDSQKSDDDSDGGSFYDLLQSI